VALADKKPPESKHGIPCSIGELLNALEGAELEAFKAMLGTPERRGWTATAIWQACRDEGHQIGLQSVNRHRGGKCRCSQGVAA
jgi:hypothetical protein